jgi:hypothetical protein
MHCFLFFSFLLQGHTSRLLKIARNNEGNHHYQYPISHQIFAEVSEREREKRGLKGERDDWTGWHTDNLIARDSYTEREREREIGYGEEGRLWESCAGVDANTSASYDNATTASIHGNLLNGWGRSKPGTHDSGVQLLLQRLRGQRLSVLLLATCRSHVLLARQAQLLCRQFHRQFFRGKGFQYGFWV